MGEAEQIGHSRTLLHTGAPTQRILSAHHDAVGVAGELEMERVFGTSMDRRLLPNGDGGIDTTLVSTTGRVWPIDVKTARIPKYLVVETTKLKPDIIYILGGYNESLNRVHLLGWMTGARVGKYPTGYCTGHTVLNYMVPRASLMPMNKIIHACGRVMPMDYNIPWEKWNP